MASDLGGRLPLLPPDQLSGAARELYQRFTNEFLKGSPFQGTDDGGELIGPFNAYLTAPEIGAALLALHGAEREATPLSARVREAIILSVGSVWRAEYELYAHRRSGSRVGLSPTAIEALASGRLSDDLADDEAIAQRLALEITRDRAVGADTYAAAEGAFGREGVVAALILAGMYGLTCTLLNALKVPAPV